jgi:alpha-tubulin suppressor-like RCC1 family protein
MRISHLHWCAAVGLMAAAACGGGGDGGSEPGPTPAISISISPGNASVVQGGSTQTTVTLTRSGGFTGAVSFSVDGAPAGVNGAVGDFQNSTATVTIQVGPTVAPQAYVLTVRATGTGVSAATAAFQLTVTEVPSFALSLSPAGGISVEQGRADNSKTVNVTRVNYVGPVTLTVEGLPNGVTASFSSNPVSGASTPMTLIATAGAAVAGPVMVTIRGTGPSTPANLTATTTFQLTVTAAPSFTLAVTPSPATVAVPVGTQDNSKTITITRTNFTGAITLSAEGLPNDVTPTFAVNPVVGESTVLTLTAAATAVVAGPITVTIRGTGPGPGGGAIEASTTLVLTVDLPIFTMVAPGERHTCARATNNAIYCWGRNVYGQLGNGTSSATPSLVPVKVVGGLSFKAVYTGGNHSCGITQNDRGFCWGAGTSGQLGNGVGTDRSAPVEIFGGHLWSTIGPLEDATCGITTLGVTLCWGENDHGQTGDGSGTPKPTPIAVFGNHTFTSLGRFGGDADDHKCGIEANGSLWCWGANQFGQIGDGTSGTDRLTPVMVGSGYKFSAQGDGATCAITVAGLSQCWGNNLNGRIGDGTTVSKATPTAVLTSLTFVAIGVGQLHVCAMNGDGVAYCWGNNLKGQLGDGTNVDRLVPGPVSGGHLFSDIRSGQAHSCGVRRDGKILCWGFNQDGRLGDNSLNDRSVPTLIAPHPP